MERFFISDFHFGDESMYRFTKSNGDKLRPWADCSLDGDWEMIKQWNNKVSKNDKVYVCGDVAMRRRGLDMMPYLNGTKVLIKGNHDVFTVNNYKEHFSDIRGDCKIKDFIVSHIPIHPASIPHWAICNIHGHVHGENVMLGDKIDKRYFNVSVESLECIPISFDEVIDKYKGN